MNEKKLNILLSCAMLLLVLSAALPLVLIFSGQTVAAAPELAAEQTAPVPLAALGDADAEMRGLWIATVNNINFPSRQGMSASALAAELDGIVDFAAENGMAEVRTKCRDKDEYLTRPDLGRCFDEENQQKIRAAVPGTPRVQIVVGDGLSSAAITANAMDCLAAIRDGLKLRGIDPGTPIFVRYCRVGAGDAIGDVTGCELVCMLVGERPGLVTDKSMSAYITYQPRTGVSESARTVVSNIHAQGTPAVEAGAHIAGLIETILKKKVSGVGLHLEAGA